MVDEKVKETVTETVALTPEERLAKAEAQTKNHMMGAMGIGLIPIPIVDFLALTALQVNMIHRMSKVYGIPFNEDKAKNIIGSLLGGGLPVAVSMPVASLIKAIPIIGQTTGVLAMPVIAGASTYALGRVFIQHFESGGTFLDFKPEEVKKYYEEQFEKGKGMAVDLKKTAAPTK